jgi:hypothetical protein
MSSYRGLHARSNGCGKRFERRECPFELAVVRDGEEPEVEGFGVQEFKR